MDTILRIVAVGAFAALPGIACAQVTFFEHEGYGGRSIVLGAAVPDLGASRFAGHASSAIVERGRWQVCELPKYGGRCAILVPGQYASLGAVDLDDLIASVRPAPSGSSPVVAPPPGAPPYGYYPRHGETLFQADVTYVRAVVGPPEQRCWVEPERVGRAPPNVGGAILGGVIGGVLGHQIGGGRGQDVATAVGAVSGVAIGANTNRGSAVQNVQRCEIVPGSAQPAYWDVTYVFRGKEYRAQLASDPGRTITVNGRGEPRM